MTENVTMGQGDGSAPLQGRPAGWYSRVDDRVLVSAMQAGDERAIEEFLRRFQLAVLLQARARRVPPDERRHWVAEVLYRVAMALSRPRTPVPRSVIAYVIASCRRAALATHRDRMARERRLSDGAGDVAGGGERAVLALCSEASVRTAFGPSWEPQSLPPVLERLLVALEDDLDDADRELLTWVGERVPYSTIADWLCITRSAAVKRVTRLRARLLDATLRIAGRMHRGERAELIRFLRRARVLDERSLETLTSPPAAGDGTDLGQPRRSPHDETEDRNGRA